jgi:hypothetical protein
MVVPTPCPFDRPIGLILILGGLSGLAYRIPGIRLKRGSSSLRFMGSTGFPCDGIPVLGNVSIIAGGAGSIAAKAFAPYAIAASSTLLLVAGIYGAWDLTLWIIKNQDKT